MAKVLPLFSGSKGNSYYISCSGSGILIDAGRSAKQLTLALDANGVDPKTIEAIFVTHEHSDHVTGLRVFANKYDIPVFTSQGTLAALTAKKYIDAKTRCFVMGSAGVDLSTMHVDRFPISHDCAEGCGFRVDMGGKYYAHATDLGVITEAVETALTGCDVVTIESNHDVNMLAMGPYPYELKRRIMSDRGHLSNVVCSQFLPGLVKSGTKRFILAHLSQENNMPEIAYRESLNCLTDSDMLLDSDFTLDVAPVDPSGKAILF